MTIVNRRDTVLLRELASKNSHSSVVIVPKVSIIRPCVMTPRWRHDSVATDWRQQHVRREADRPLVETTNSPLRLSAVATVAGFCRRLAHWLLTPLCLDCKSRRADLFEGRCVPCFRARLLAFPVPQGTR